VQTASLSSRGFLEKFIITERYAKKSKPKVRDAKKSKQEARETKKLKPDATSGRTTKIDHETQTEPNIRQRDCASADEQENVRRLEDENRKMSELVEDYERKTVLLNEEMESILRNRKSHIQHIKMRYEEENEHQLLKMDMRDELLWYKKRLPGIRMPTGLNG
jgi:tRNA U34 5-carboxymethylaminomethyl modifying GTPase MnmE/TrmE